MAHSASRRKVMNWFIILAWDAVGRGLNWHERLSIIWKKTKGLPSDFRMMRSRSWEMHSGSEWIFVKLWVAIIMIIWDNANTWKNIVFLWKSHILISTEPNTPLNDADHVGSFNFKEKIHGGTETTSTINVNWWAGGEFKRGQLS